MHLQQTLKKTKMLYDSFEELSPYIVLSGSDKVKYRSLEKGFVNQYSLKTTNILRTSRTLSKHMFDKEFHTQTKGRNEKCNKQRQKEEEEDEPKKALTFA